MKKTLTTIFGLAMLATTAHAHEVTSYKRVCDNVETPIYGERTVTTQGGDAGEGALAGMIIGGILGKGVSGNDKGAAAGAVIGGIIGADKAQKGGTRTERYITGYKTERVCNNVAVSQSHTHANVVPVGKAGPIETIYRITTNTPGKKTCTWEDEYKAGHGWVEVQVCRKTSTVKYKYELVVRINGKLYRDTTFNSNLQVGDWWKLTKTATFN
jgi:outer membrane lipoprotein SlyB